MKRETILSILLNVTFVMCIFAIRYFYVKKEYIGGCDIIKEMYETGDLAKLFLEHSSKPSQVTCVDPNRGMIKKAKEKLRNYNDLNWIIAPAEKLPLKKDIFDTWSIHRIHLLFLRHKY